MPPKTTTKAGAEKLSDKPVEKPAELPPADQVKGAPPVTPPPDTTLEDAAKQLAAEAPPATIPPPDSPTLIGVDPAKPGSETTALVDIELVQDEGEPTIRICALYPVTHNGTTYGPGLPAGDELAVTPDERDRLVGLGVIEEEGDEV
jgi:hypothetical protein